MYLASQMPGRTVLLMTGGSVRALESACRLARMLTPATIILEDVDRCCFEQGRGSRAEDGQARTGGHVGAASAKSERNPDGRNQERARDGRVDPGGAARRDRSARRLGHAYPDARNANAGPETVYILASISKPITVLMLMLLVERGDISLNDPVQKYLPEFKGPGRDKVRVLDLLAHTSGLPDMLPENVKLREANAPLNQFVKGAMTTPLLFEPRTSFSYSSMGTLLAAEIVERVTKMPLGQFEERELFGPLKMKNSSLGLGKRALADTARVQGDSFAQTEKDLDRYGANSTYLRKLGHPWGGMHSTVDDIGIVLQMSLNSGVYDGKRILGRATVEAMTADHNKRLGRPWRLGWALQASSTAFGDLSSERTFGHSGASGTIAWADPERELLCVILTTRPWRQDRGFLLRRIGNVVQGAID
jgi:CubicO group peptidase (beta-lactamase class C family)